MKALTTAFAIAAVMGAIALPVLADSASTLPLDLAAMPGKTIWNGNAVVTPLSMDAHGKPSTVVIRMKPGVQGDAAHATGDGQVRIATVLAGTMYFADGDQVDPAKEIAYGPGSILLIDSGTPHWLSSHDGEVVIMLTAVPADRFSPPVQAQQGASQ